MIYSDSYIKHWAKNGGIKPYYEQYVNPASIDLTLGSYYRTPEPVFADTLFGRLADGLYRDLGIKIKYFIESYKWSDQHLIPKDGLEFRQGDFILCHSKEIVKMFHNTVGILFLKSTIGRSGIEHLHAGYVDPGFEGQLTFELQMCFPGKIILKKNMRIMQLCIEECGEVQKSYQKTGHYIGENAKGAVKPVKSE